MVPEICSGRTSGSSVLTGQHEITIVYNVLESHHRLPPHHLPIVGLVLADLPLKLQKKSDNGNGMSYTFH